MKSSQDIEKCIHQLVKILYGKKRNKGQLSQGKILKILYNNGDMSQKEMQEKLDIQSGSMSELINKLENKKFIIRLKDNYDRRKVILHLTEEGRRDVERYRQEYQNQMTHYFYILDQDEKETLYEILIKLLDQGELPHQTRE